MEKTCAIIPTVLDSEGQKKESILFKELLEFTGSRQETKRIWGITQTKEFKDRWLPILKVDSNGEPTVRSMIEKTNLGEVITEAKVLEKLNKDIGYYHKTGRAKLYLDNNEQYDKLLKRVIDFNKNSEFSDRYVATIKKVADSESGKYYIAPKIEVRNALRNLESANMSTDYSLNILLRETLAGYGVSIGALTELEERRGIAGVTDFSRAKDATDGIIELIRLAKGERGEKALPEEFAHFALEALGDNPLVNRLLNTIREDIPDILGDEYETYRRLYGGNELRLAKEAAGKLVAEHLGKEHKKRSYDNLVSRIVNKIKEFFSKMDYKLFERLKNNSDYYAGTIAKGMLDGSLRGDISNIKSQDSLYDIKEEALNESKVLSNIINTEMKRLSIYQGDNKKFTANQKVLISDLETKLLYHVEKEGIYNYLIDAIEVAGNLKERLKILKEENLSLNEKSSVLRDIHNYLYSYSSVLEDIRELLIDKEEGYEDIKEATDNLSNALEYLRVDFRLTAIPMFIEFLKPFMGQSIEVPFGKLKGKVIRVEELVKRADSDISFFDRWLDSMADSSDYMLKLIDQAVKVAKNKARLNIMDVAKKLQAAHIKLEKAGIKDTSWMFERDEKGNKTGNYASLINYNDYNNARKRAFESLNNEQISNIERTRRKHRWEYDNTEIIDGVRVPKRDLYPNRVMSSWNSAQREYYDTIMNVREDMLKFLPEGTLKDPMLTVQVRKDLLERVKSSRNVKEGISQMWENLKDQVVAREDDTDFGIVKGTEDFRGREVKELPIYYVNPLSNMNDLSEDVTSTMIAFVAMAEEYDAMNKVIDSLEVGRILLEDREIAKTQGSRPIIEKLSVMGRTITSKLNKTNSNFMARLNSFFDMQVYGRYMKDEGKIWGMDIGKLANFVNKTTALNSLALNLLSGISNIATGKVMMRIESIAGEFFTERDTIKADSIYAKEVPSMMSEIGSRIKASKIALFDELFDVMQDYDTKIKNVEFDKKRFSRFFSTNTLFFMNNAGEHWMQNRTALALANAYKMKDPKGSIVSLWDSLEVSYTDNDKSLGGKLKLKEGYTKEDGSEFMEEDIYKFTRRIAAINQRMHGIYNRADRNAAQALAIGRLALMYRKYLVPSLNRRFRKATYNFDLGSFEEGYYTTSTRFLWQLGKDIREGKMILATRWKDLTPTERANLKRALTETSHFVVLCLFLALYKVGDRDRPWLERLFEYQAKRLRTELGALIPSASMVGEMWTILKSPAAGLRTAESLGNMVGAINPLNYGVFNEDAILQSGRYKGKSRGFKAIMESPFFPTSKTIYRALHPEELVSIYN